MKTIYVLDTSVLISDPEVYLTLTNSKIVIPVTVLEELDSLKATFGDKAKQARTVIRNLDKISNNGDLHIGIQLENGSTLSVDTGNHNGTDGDSRILSTAYFIKQCNMKDDVIVISNDINMRVRAKARGLLARGHEPNKVNVNSFYECIKVIDHAMAAHDLQVNQIIDPENYDLNVNINDCLLFTNYTGQNIALGRVVGKNKIKVVRGGFDAWGIKPKNKEQLFAMDMLLDPSLDLVTLTGTAGSGKSLLSLAVGLQMVLEVKAFQKLIVYRPIQEVGNAIGFTPGSIDEKLAPWYEAINDSFEILFAPAGSSDDTKKNWRASLDMYKKKGKIEYEAMTYIRGRSITNALILVDEAQNIHPNDMKTILTRAGVGTKFIITGDIEQIDNPKLDSTNNGLSYVISKFKNCELAGNMALIQGERSRLASYAAKVM